MWKKWPVLLLLILSFTEFSRGQELKCTVSIASQKIQGTNRELFANMQRDIYEFLNNKRWSKYIFAQEERIECSLQVILDEQSGSGQFKGSMQIRISRPVYNSAYSTVLLNYKDNDIDFTYREFEPLEYNETGQNSNLVNLLVFYANIILGFDADSFSLMGGNEFFDRAEQIMTRCQNTREAGWKSFESRHNRYWLIHDLQDRSYVPLRECLYRYHRLGLDRMPDQTTEGRTAIVNALELLQKVHRSKPNSYIMQVFFDAKSDEIVKIFRSAYTEERKQVFNILSEADPAHRSKYQVLIQEKTN